MSTTDSDEVDYQAQYDQIEIAAKNQLALLHEDLTHLLGGENIYDQRQEFAKKRLAQEDDAFALSAEGVSQDKDRAYDAREGALSESRLTAIAKTDEINNAVVKAGFVSGPSGARDRKMLTDSLAVKAGAGDLNYLDSLEVADTDFKSDVANFGSAELDYQEDSMEAENDLYESLRSIYSEIESVKGETQGSTGRSASKIGWNNYDWGNDDDFSGWDDVWDSFDT